MNDNRSVDDPGRATATQKDHRGIVWRARKILFRARLVWQFKARPRIARMTWFVDKLPWTLWLWLCPPDADAIVRELGRRWPGPLRFVQIGSNDGVTNDPLNETVRARGWSGVLVEPLPRMFERLVANYQGVPGLTFANVAIAPEEGTLTLYTVERRPGEPEWADQIASFDREVTMRHTYALKDLENRIVPVDVECLTIGSLVARYGLTTIDLLHIDAEGLDYELVSALPMNEPWTPRFLIFEAKHMTVENYDSLRARLKRGGYHFFDVHPDVFAYRTVPGRVS